MPTVPTAKEMASNLASLSNLLCKEELINPKSKNSLDAACGKLRKLGQVQSYRYTIDSVAPIKFVPIGSKKLKQIAPHVYIDVAINPPTKDDLPPFSQLVTVIEVWDVLKNDLQLRWHLDLANRSDEGHYQAGPLFHLQAGGHQPKGNRKDDLKVSIPRWEMPPKELILACEMILANFYPDKWNKIKRQQRWLELIQFAQSLCYPMYFQRVQNSLERQQSVLEALWATEWGTTGLSQKT
ncbi:MAG: hypothetical protein DRR16_26995 [Candidatus Parabeggiatoa sp. nov. 3]|jgi:hypothetical protein|nr:MAG: hypothetical protein DRR00_28845 [Gammaproteobacteria bacterium]RKZ57632.1 MAG: hypothetical protein DRQ99_26660 [Gammaproteobacteria bacterium]RKZ78793.1 MAG: hypothetical protein DRR16_26995 [Gammaproteobacteria bacterium]